MSTKLKIKKKALKESSENFLVLTNPGEVIKKVFESDEVEDQIQSMPAEIEKLWKKVKNHANPLAEMNAPDSDQNYQTFPDISNLERVECKLADGSSVIINPKKISMHVANLLAWTKNVKGLDIICKYWDTPIIWTFEVPTAATDGCRIFFNPLFAHEILKKGIDYAATEEESAKESGKPFNLKLKKSAILLFVIVHEAYHQIYRHIAREKIKPVDPNDHMNANYAEDAEINRDIEYDFPNLFGGIVSKSVFPGIWEADQFPYEIWEDIFDSFKSGEKTPKVPGYFSKDPIDKNAKMQPPSNSQKGQCGQSGQQQSGQQQSGQPGQSGQGGGQSGQGGQEGQAQSGNQSGQSGQGGQGKPGQSGQPGQGGQSSQNGDSGNSGQSGQSSSGQQGSGNDAGQSGQSGQGGEGESNNDQADSSANSQSSQGGQSSQNGEKGDAKGASDGSSQTDADDSSDPEDDVNKAKNASGDYVEGFKKGLEDTLNHRIGGDAGKSQEFSKGYQDAKNAAEKYARQNTPSVDCSNQDRSFTNPDEISKEDGMKLAHDAGQDLSYNESQSDPNEKAKDFVEQNIDELSKIGSQRSGSKNQGRGSGSMGQRLERIKNLFRPKINWRAALKNIFNTCSKSGDIKYDIRKKLISTTRDDRYVKRKETPIPKKNAISSICYIVDNSGSMYSIPGVFDYIMTEIFKLEDTCKVEQSTYTYFADGISKDKKTYRVWRHGTSTSQKMKMIGHTPNDIGGGTDILRSMLEAMALPKPYFSKSTPMTKLIVLSDGESYELRGVEKLPYSMKLNVIFVLINSVSSNEKTAKILEDAGIKRNHIIPINEEDIQKEMLNTK